MQYRPTISHSLLVINWEEYARNDRVLPTFMGMRSSSAANSRFMNKKTKWKFNDNLLMVWARSVFQIHFLYILICKTMHLFLFFFFLFYCVLFIVLTGFAVPINTVLKKCLVIIVLDCQILAISFYNSKFYNYKWRWSWNSTSWEKKKLWIFLSQFFFPVRETLLVSIPFLSFSLFLLFSWHMHKNMKRKSKGKIESSFELKVIVLGKGLVNSLKYW